MLNFKYKKEDKIHNGGQQSNSWYLYEELNNNYTSNNTKQNIEVV